MPQQRTGPTPSVESVVRYSLGALEGEARALGAMPLPPDRQRELLRIQERLRELHEQLAFIADAPE